MTEENKPLSAPNTAVQRLAREAIWVQGVTQTLLRGINTSPVVPVQQEAVTKLARALFVLAEQDFKQEAWKDVIAAAELGANVAADLDTARNFVPPAKPKEPKPTNRKKNVSSSKSS